VKRARWLNYAAFLLPVGVAIVLIMICRGILDTSLADTMRGQILFRADSGERDTVTFVVNADGSNLMRFSERMLYDDWSADGASIVYSDNGQSPTSREIWVRDVASGATRQLTDNNVDDYSAAWSPDASQIAFISQRDGQPDLYIMNADGSDVSRLTLTGKVYSSIAWSPDGSGIVYVCGEPRDICVVGVDGSQLINLTNDSAMDGNPVWTPDSTRIVFWSDRSGNAEIYIMNADGSNPVNLTNNDAADRNPDVSPDGTQIVFASERDRIVRVVVMNLDGSDQHSPAVGWEPIWHP